MSDLQDWKSILLAYNALTIISIALIIFTLLPPLLCKGVRRRPPWYSHMLSWLVAAIALLLLIGHQRDNEPPLGLCFVQSALLYATPPLIAFSMAFYLLDTSLPLISLFAGRPLKRTKVGASIVLALFPWLVFWAVIVEVSVFFATASEGFTASGNPNLHLFCHYNSKPANIISGTLIIIGAVILFSTKALVAILLFRKFRTYDWSSTRISHMILSAVIRTSIFAGIVLAGVVIGEVSCTFESHIVGWSLVLPTLPIAAAVMYGVHTDVIQCLRFWKKAEEEIEQESEASVKPKDEEKQ